MAPLDRFFATRRKRGYRRTVRWRLASPVGRIRVLLLAIAVIFSLCAGRALQIQGFDAEAYAADAAEQMTVAQPIPAMRGTITDRTGDVLAYTEPTVNVVADPEMIRTNGKFTERMTQRDQDIAATAAVKLADILARHIGGDPTSYQAALTKPGSRYSIVARRVAPGTFSRISDEIRKADLLGVYRETAPTRRYPNGVLAANLIGFVGPDNVGVAGLEQTLNKPLAGTPGREVYETSPNGKIPLGTNVLNPAINGQNYQLTIDSGMQWMTEQRLAYQVRYEKASYGTAVVMNIKTGEILAMANYPSFDANNYGKADPEVLGNRAIGAVYEPGSVQKVLTFGALLDSNTVRPDDVVTIPPEIRAGDNVVHDAWNHDTIRLTARGVLARSSNIGTITLARRMSKQTLANYLKSFGLGQRPGLGLPGESPGYLPGGSMPDYSRDYISFGMGVSVTTVQQAAAVAALANRGVYNSPTLIKSIQNPDGTPAQVQRPAPRRVISVKASKQLVAMMETSTVRTHKGNLAIKNYRTATKTGTARRLDTKCGCYKGHVASIIGVGPTEDPQILVYMVITDPKRHQAGYKVAGPAYRDIMMMALPRYGIPASTTPPGRGRING